MKFHSDKHKKFMDIIWLLHRGHKKIVFHGYINEFFFWKLRNRFESVLGKLMIFKKEHKIKYIILNFN